MYADEYRLTSCLINLLKNAFDAMDHTGTVHVDVSQENNFIRVDIRDSGGGITPEVMSHMYDPHFSTKLASSGLGLPITKQFITEMNGELLCNTRLGEGTTFTIKIPIYIAYCKKVLIYLSSPKINIRSRFLKTLKSPLAASSPVIKAF